MGLGLHFCFVVDASEVSSNLRAQSAVDFPIGGHVNVLSDYKET